MPPKKHKKSPRKRQSRKKGVTPEEKNDENKSWVDKIVMRPASDGGGPSLALISWNVLAQGYCRRSSHTGLPLDYQKVIFSPKRRIALLHRCLEQLGRQADVLCLQEVDDALDVASCLEKCGFVESVETPRGPPHKRDSLGVYVRPDSGWRLEDHQVVHLDNLATLPANEDNETSSATTISHLHGFQSTFLRRNMGLLVRLRHEPSQQTIVLVHAHLYWNPRMEYVKLLQCHYLLECAQNYRKSDDEAVVLAGDLNSQPHGMTHMYLTQGIFDASHAAPWWHHNLIRHDPLEQGMEALTLSKGPTDEPMGDVKDDATETNIIKTVKYMFDASLNKLCRWLRILGQDAALETDLEEQERTRNNSTKDLFKKCRREGRVLVTTSPRLLQRSDCPTGSYLVHSSSLNGGGLEGVLVHLLKTHGVTLRPVDFLSRCVVCNGFIIEIEDEKHKRRILESYQAPTKIATQQVYECDNDQCRQGYWYSDKPTSSASRVKGTATRLFTLCVRASVAFDEDLGLFGDVDVNSLKASGLDVSDPNDHLLHQELRVVDWLRSELKRPFALESAYARRTSNGDISGESIPFTNVTESFVNVLDYIFYETDKMAQIDRLPLPASFREMNPQGMKGGHLVPSALWPSDHLAIGARFSLDREAKPSMTAPVLSSDDIAAGAGPTAMASLFCAPIGSIFPIVDSPSTTTPHGRRCDCGCVPPTPSLFEMAEFRKQARLARQGNETSS